MAKDDEGERWRRKASDLDAFQRAVLQQIQCW
jgi:hypothetical protein